MINTYVKRNKFFRNYENIKFKHVTVIVVDVIIVVSYIHLF